MFSSSRAPCGLSRHSRATATARIVNKFCVVDATIVMPCVAHSITGELANPRCGRTSASVKAGGGCLRHCEYKHAPCIVDFLEYHQSGARIMPCRAYLFYPHVSAEYGYRRTAVSQHKSKDMSTAQRHAPTTLRPNNSPPSAHIERDRLSRCPSLC